MLAGLIQLYTLAEHGKMLNCIAHFTVTAVQSVVSPALGTGKHEEGAGGVQDRQDQAHWAVLLGLPTKQFGFQPC